MKIAVWDTYVSRKDGLVMHFDILVLDTLTDEDKIFGYGKSYLNSKPFTTKSLTSKECKLCHIDQATPEIIKRIRSHGYFIIEMENCQ